jgi:hypothetical protein
MTCCLGASLVFIVCLLVGFVPRLTAADSFPDAMSLPVRTNLPDPLLTFNGVPVTTRDAWLNQRRPELKALFQHYMYGQLPPAPDRIQTTVERVNRNLFSGKATGKEVTIRFGSPNLPAIHLLLVTPNRSWA